jgi:hypothetical protein
MKALPAVEKRLREELAALQVCAAACNFDPSLGVIGVQI